MRRLPGLLAMLALAAGGLSYAAPARANLLISVDKTHQQMTVVVDGQPRYIWPVSTGRVGYNTPSGTFKPFRMDKDHVSQQYDNAPMPYSIFFTMHGDAIHGTDEVKHIGRAVSHGCVRLTPAHAAILWKLVKAEGMNKTQVVINGRIPGAGEAVARSTPDTNRPSYSQGQAVGTPDRTFRRRGDLAAVQPYPEADDGSDVTGTVGPSGPGWRAVEQGGRIYYYRTGPQEVQRVYPRGYYRPYGSW